MKTKFLMTFAIFAITTFATAIYAQEQKTQGDRQIKQTQASTASMTAPTLPQVLASKLMLGNQCMINQSRMAVERAQHPEVREFAQLLVSEHAKGNESLKTLVPQSFIKEMMAMDQARDGQAKSDTDRQTADTRQADQTETVNRDRPANSETNLIQQLCDIEKSATIKKSDAMHKMLKEHESTDFDMAFVGTQIVTHTEMLACLQAIQEAKVPELNQVCDQAIAMTKKHLDKAQSLAETLAKKTVVKK